jgi:hypothetical protein
MIIILAIFLEKYFQGKNNNLMFKILPFKVQSVYQIIFFHGWNQQNIYSPWVTFSSMCTNFFGEKKLSDKFNEVAHGTMFWVQVFQGTHGWGCCPKENPPNSPYVQCFGLKSIREHMVITILWAHNIFIWVSIEKINYKVVTFNKTFLILCCTSQSKVIWPLFTKF